MDKERSRTRAAADAPCAAVGPGDALIVVDVQRDFLPGGSLAVPGGDEVVPLLNRALALFARRGLPIFVTRDWHPADHVSFRAQGGPWPPHCVRDTVGARFAAALELPPAAVVISKATEADREAYSGFDGTHLARLARESGALRLLVGGLATDYCVRRTVLDARREGFETILLADAVRAVDVHPGDGAAAVEEMQRAGARVARAAELCP